MKSKITFSVKIIGFILFSIGFWLFTFQYLETLMHIQPITQDYNAPLRHMNLVFQKVSEKDIQNTLSSFGSEHGFAIRVTPYNTPESTMLIEMYRSDIRYKGYLNKKSQENAESSELDLTVYRTSNKATDKYAITQGVGAFKKTMHELGKVNIREEIFASGDTLPEYGTSINSLLNAKIQVPNGTHNNIRKNIYEFADKNNFALRVSKLMLGAEYIDVMLFKEGVKISISTRFSDNELGVTSYPVTGAVLTEDELLKLYAALKNEVEIIEGVSFKIIK